MNQITAVTILIKDPNTGFYLGVSRKDDPNAFGLPGGKVDPGETPVEAAVRELHEETGLIGDPNTAHEVFRRPCEGGKDGVEFFVATFVMATSGEINTTETGRVSWISQRVLFDGPFGKYNKALLDAVIICQDCRGQGFGWQGEVCSECKGKMAIVRPRALLLDDYRTPEHVVRYADHHKIEVYRDSMAAANAVESNPVYDMWILDRDLIGDTTYSFLHYVGDLDKWPNRIDVVSESNHARRLAMDVKAMCPKATVTLRGQPVGMDSNWVTEANAITEAFVTPVVDMTFHVYRNTAVDVLAMVRPATANKPWHDAGKKSKGTMHIKRKKGK